MIVRLKIPYHFDREKIVMGLANSGYKVWVEEEKTMYSTEYFILFECDDFTGPHKTVKEKL